jgi:hypothetical protein
MAKQMRGAEDPDPGSTVETDVAQEAPESASEPSEPQYVVVEYVGHEPYGREFIASHTIQKSSADPKHKTERLSFAGQAIEVPEDLVWHKDTGWVVKVDSTLTELIEALRTQPDLKVRD